MQDNLAERIFICGFMGAGKSTVAQALAQRLELALFDLDTIIEEQAGQTIPDIFETKGEEYFRKIEREVLTHVACEKKGVIALGGGALHNHSIVDELKSNGVLVFLRVSTDTILQRVVENENRPMLWDDDGQIRPKEQLKKEIGELYQQRLPLYRQADITVKGDNSLTVDNITDQLIKKMKKND